MFCIAEPEAEPVVRWLLTAVITEPVGFILCNVYLSACASEKNEKY